MKKALKYIILILSMVGFNFLAFLISFLFTELDYKLDDVLYNSVIPIFILITFYIIRFINKNNLNLTFCLILIYMTLIVLRIVEIYIGNRISFSWCSLGIIEVLYNLLFDDTEDFLYWWSAIAFPLFQPFCIYVVYEFSKLRKRTTQDNINESTTPWINHLQ